MERLTIAIVSVAFGLTAAAAAHGQATPPRRGASLDAPVIEQLTGAKGQLDEKEGVFKVSVPRDDLRLEVAGVKVPPAMGVTSWAAFQGTPEHATVMGDLVLAEDQANPVMSVALDSGLDVTALHNHFLWDSPRVMFMHVGGMGDEKALATAIGKVFSKMRETAGGKGERPVAKIDPGRSSLDASRIEAALGVKGKLDHGVYKVTLGRTTRMDGVEVGNAMGVNTWAAFAGSDEKALVDGDFAMLEGELQPVLKALRGAGMDVVSIHQHMAGEQPRILFLHYWGLGRAADLARGLRAALDRTTALRAGAAGR